MEKGSAKKQTMDGPVSMHGNTTGRMHKGNSPPNFYDFAREVIV